MAYSEAADELEAALAAPCTCGTPNPSSHYATYDALANKSQPCKHNGGRDYYSESHSRCWECGELLPYAQQAQPKPAMIPVGMDGNGDVLEVSNPLHNQAQQTAIRQTWPICGKCGQPYVSIPRMGIGHACPQPAQPEMPTREMVASVMRGAANQPWVGDVDTKRWYLIMADAVLTLFAPKQ